MRKRRWLRAALALAILLLVASWGFSLALRGGWARRSLLARVSASFGRPVDVGHFSFSLLSGPRLEADRVTVAEDPRFGQEYFLRADGLTLSLRWTALLRGRFEFGVLSFSQPSLNLVHAPDGHWNIESWLPPATPPAQGAGSFGPPVAPVAHAIARLARIEIDGGRINFKRDTEKLPFALVDVNGNLERDAAGRWTIDIEARPTRAPIAVQDAGILRLRGSVAGTSARLRPANLDLTWEQASLADVIRLALGTDRGIRGAMAGEVSASIANPADPADTAGSAAWNMSGSVRFSAMHRWDFAGRDTDPAVNVKVAARWQPGKPRLEVTQCLVEAPHSSLGATGELDWTHGADPRLRLVSAQLGLEDLLDWRRAFLPGTADDLSVEGTIGLDAVLAGWPPSIEQAAIASTGAVLHTAELPGAIRIGRFRASLRRGSLQMDPVSVDLPGAPQRTGARNASVVEPAPAGVLRVTGVLGPLRAGADPRDWPYQLSVAGQTARARDLLTLAAAFGGPAAESWSIAGPVALDLRWTGALHRRASVATGTIGFHGLQISSVVANYPLVISSASVELRPDEWRVKISEADGFGAHWKGLLDRRAVDGSWTFDLSADRLDGADLDSWLGPRARPSLFERMLPFAQPVDTAPARDAALAGLTVRGRLRVDAVDLAPLRLEKLDTAAEIDGRKLQLRDAQVDFYGGHVSGDFEANLSADPSYTFRGQIDRANLSALADPVMLPGRFAGIGAGDLNLSAHGIGKENLLATLTGEGALRLRELVFHDAKAVEVVTGNASDAAAPIDMESRFAAGKLHFRIVGGRILVDQMSLADRNRQLDVDGSLDFARHLDLRIQSLPRVGAAAVTDPDADVDRNAWVVAGTLDAPLVNRPTHEAGNRVGSPGSRR